jgi:hypothetical protein
MKFIGLLSFLGFSFHLITFVLFSLETSISIKKKKRARQDCIYLQI